MGTGGARNWAGRPGWRPKAEHHRSLDVRRFAAENMLRPGAWTWSWRDSETQQEVASISIIGAVGRLTLAYTADGEAIRTEVAIARTACGFGGARPWFQCPRCGSRVAKLYLRSKRFACRHCHRMSYASQSNDICGRTWGKQRKLEARLGANWQRPKHMHHKTYARLLAAILTCEQARDDWLAGAMVRLMGGLERLKDRFPGLHHDE